MLRIDVRRARPGMKLALPVYNPKAPDRVLLKLGYDLTEKVVHRLVDAGVSTLWVQYPPLQHLEKVLDVTTMRVQQEVVGSITSTFETLQTQSAARLHYEDYTRTIVALIDHMACNPNAALFLGDLFNADDDLLRHSAAVTYISVLIGMKMETYIVQQRKHVDPGRAKEIINLGLGAMLHDIGVIGLEQEVRDVHAQTGDETDPAWREHPSIGFRMVRGRIEPSAATVVLNHHQRFDGDGYAGEDFPVLDGQSIHIFARIGAVADAFDHLRVPVEAEPPRPTVAVLQELVKTDLAHRFDPKVLMTLLSVVPPYPPGTVLRLSDGRWAAAIDHNPEDPCRPVVQIIDSPDEWPPMDVADPEPAEQVDLAMSHAGLYVAECDGQDVEAFNFRRPNLASLAAA